MRSRTGKFAPRRPRLEPLEDRVVLFATLTQGGNLWVEGGAGNDHAEVTLKTVDDEDYYQVNINNETKDFKVSDVTGGRVYFYGRDGNDTFDNKTALETIAYGGAGDDVLTTQSGGYLYGEAGNDQLVNLAPKLRAVVSGGDGNDVLTGSGGDDMLYGDAGNDTINGGGGKDYIDGGAGNDTIDGGLGADIIFGGFGNDVIQAGADSAVNQIDGGAGSDRIYGGNGADRIWCGNDNSVNYVYARAGNDIVYGGSGIDFLYGEAGNDLLVGGNGDDRLYGGLGYDQLYGQNGNDYLDGGNDKVGDFLVGGAGRDYFKTERILIAGVWQTRERRVDFASNFDRVYG